MSIKNLILSKYRIRGLNIERLLNRLFREKIEVVSARRPANNEFAFSVRLKDDEKVFAILKNMCYNILARKKGGIGYPVYYLSKRLGILTGALIFIATALFCNNLVFRLRVTGSGAVYEREIMSILHQNGIETGKFFSGIDFDYAENQILRGVSQLSFVTVEKKGNTLLVDAELSSEKPPVIDTGIRDIYSDIDGVLKRAVVLRGTLLFNIGDTVKAGDMLVAGYTVAGEINIPTYVLCDLWIESEAVFIYKIEFKYAHAEDLAKEFAIDTLQADRIEDIITTRVTDGTYTMITVKVRYLRHLNGG